MNQFAMMIATNNVVTEVPENPDDISGLIHKYIFDGVIEDDIGTKDIDEDEDTYEYDATRGPCIKFNNGGVLSAGSAFDILNFTVSFWVKKSISSAGTNHTILANGNGSNAVTFVFRDDPNDYNGLYVTANDTDVYSYEAGTEFNDGNWHHIVVSRSSSSSEFSMYLDGVKHTPKISSGGTFDDSDNFAIGRYLNAKSEVECNISMLRIYDRRLLDNEVQAIFDYESNNTHSYAVDNGLLAYIPLKRNALDHTANQADMIENNSDNVTYNGNYCNKASGSYYISSTNNAKFQVTDKSNWFQCIWFKTNQDDDYPVIIELADELRSEVRIRKDTSYGIQEYDGSDTLDSSTKHLNDNSWYHICIGKRDGISEIWINGVKDAEGTTARDSASHTSLHTSIGSYHNSSDYMHGSFARARLYDRQLSQAEIESIYNSELGELT